MTDDRRRYSTDRGRSPQRSRSPSEPRDRSPDDRREYSPRRHSSPPPRGRSPDSGSRKRRSEHVDDRDARELSPRPHKRERQQLAPPGYPPSSYGPPRHGPPVYAPPIYPPPGFGYGPPGYGPVNYLPPIYPPPGYGYGYGYGYGPPRPPSHEAPRSEPRPRDTRLSPMRFHAPRTSDRDRREDREAREQPHSRESRPATPERRRDRAATTSAIPSPTEPRRSDHSERARGSDDRSAEPPRRRPTSPERPPRRARDQSLSPVRKAREQSPSPLRERRQSSPGSPVRISFEASGDASRPLAYARELERSGAPFDLQVGIFEGERDAASMPGTRENVRALQRIEGVRITYNRDATHPPSPTRYDHIAVTNIMAVGPRGESDTRPAPNAELTRGVMEAQAPKLKEGGQLHFGASGNPYFKPGKSGVDRRTGRLFDDKVDVDRLAEHSGLTRQPDREYVDALRVKKNEGRQNVGVAGTYTRVYSRGAPGPELPVPMPQSHPVTERERGVPAREPPRSHAPLRERPPGGRDDRDRAPPHEDRDRRPRSPTPPRRDDRYRPSGVEDRERRHRSTSSPPPRDDRERSRRSPSPRPRDRGGETRRDERNKQV